MKISAKVIFWILVLAVYLNIGWGLSHYYEYNVFHKPYEELSLTAKALSFAGWIANRHGSQESENRHAMGEQDNGYNISFSILWPVLPIISFIIWLIYYIYLLLWFIFAGGIFKTF